MVRYHRGWEGISDQEQMPMLYVHYGKPVGEVEKVSLRIHTVIIAESKRMSVEMRMTFLQ